MPGGGTDWFGDIAAYGVLLTAIIGGIASLYRWQSSKQAEVERWRREVDKSVDDNRHLMDLANAEIARLKSRLREQETDRRHMDKRFDELKEALIKLTTKVELRLNGQAHR